MLQFYKLEVKKYNVPIYEYECPICKDTLERIEKVNENIKEPICNKCLKPMKKIMSKNTFVLHGHGFYATDYKNPAKNSVPT